MADETAEELEIYPYLLDLLDQRNKAIAEIEIVQKPGSPQMIKWQKDREKIKKRYSVTNPNGVVYIPAEHERAYRHAIRRISRKTAGNRAERVDTRFTKNIERYLKSFENEASRQEKTVESLVFYISDLKQSLERLVDDICKFTKNEILGSTKSISEDASKRIATLRLSVEEKQKSIEDLEQDLLKSKPKASIAREKAKFFREKMGCTLKSFISYLENLKKKEHEKLEEFMRNNELNDFEKTQTCILKLEKFTKEVDSNLEEICNAVQDSSRSGLHASFSISTKRVNLFLNKKTNHDMTLMDYLHYLKDSTRKRDVEELQKSITQICSKITERIECLSALDPDVEFLRGRIKHYNELLEEKKRSCK
jgi:hypothetical protein